MPLNPDFPVVHGLYQLTSNWRITLPSEFNQRTEANGDLVLWQPGLTVWIAVWTNDKNETADQRLNRVKGWRSPAAESIREQQIGSVLFYVYRLAEPADDQRAPAVYCWAFGDKSQVQAAVYFDNEQSAPVAEALCFSLTDQSA